MLPPQAPCSGSVALLAVRGWQGRYAMN